MLKHLDGTMSEAERQQLDAWKNESIENQKIWSRLTSETELAEALKEMHTYDEQAGWDVLKQRLGANEKYATNRFKRWFPRFAAAAMISGLLIGSYYYFSSPPNDEKDNGNKLAVIQSDNDKLPGREGALLILPNGEELSLDTLQNGAIIDATTKISNKNGHLVWEQNTREKNKAAQWNTIITRRGRQFNITLSDGSKVWLNSASSIRFPSAFPGNERTVQITGEVYFEVAHMRAKPFRVQTGKLEIEVLGTTFNINAFEDEQAVRTTLINGKVLVKTAGQATPLEPGQQASFYSADSQLKIDKDADLQTIMAWRSGMFEFNDLELGDIMRQISRWYDVDIVFEGEPGHEKYGGAISKQLPLKNVLRMLEVHGVTFTLEQNRLLIKP